MSESNSGNGGRTHEPSLREVVAQLDGLRELIDERDKRYDERHRAGEKAIEKSEAAQNSYNATHNDLVRKMDAQYREMLPRTEADNRFNAVHEKVEDVKKGVAILRESKSEIGGRDVQGTASRDRMQWGLVFVILVVGLVVQIVIAFMKAAGK